MTQEQAVRNVICSLVACVLLWGIAVPAFLDFAFPPARDWFSAFNGIFIPTDRCSAVIGWLYFLSEC
jgi:hypothetical protein